jgi:hypothetical protein
MYNCSSHLCSYCTKDECQQEDELVAADRHKIAAFEVKR